MKKSQLYVGIGYILFGIVCIGIALITEFKQEGMLWGFAGAGIAPGIMMIWKYLHWSKPQNKPVYEAMLKQEKIEMQDERKMMLRDKSGAFVYRMMIFVYCFLIFLFSFISISGDYSFSAMSIMFGLIILLFFQYILGFVVFARLNKKL